MRSIGSHAADSPAATGVQQAQASGSAGKMSMAAAKAKARAAAVAAALRASMDSETALPIDKAAKDATVACAAQDPEAAPAAAPAAAATEYAPAASATPDTAAAKGPEEQADGACAHSAQPSSSAELAALPRREHANEVTAAAGPVPDSSVVEVPSSEVQKAQSAPPDAMAMEATTEAAVAPQVHATHVLTTNVFVASKRQLASYAKGRIGEFLAARRAWHAAQKAAQKNAGP